MPSNKPPVNKAVEPRLRVGFVLARHFTLTAFANFIDTLRLAADEGDGSRQILCRWRVMSASGLPVASSCGIAVTPDSGFVEPDQFHYIVVAGGLLHRGDQIDEATAQYLRRAAQAGVALIGICTGSFVLKRLGLLEKRKVCVSWYHHSDYVEEFDEAPVADRLYIMDRDRITCSGGAGVVDLAAALVEKHVGGQAARKSLNVLLLDGQRAAEAVQPTPRVAPAAADARVRRAVLAMEQAMTEPLKLAALAVRVGVSERQLARLFRAELGAGPAEIYRAMRLDYGRWLLAHSNRSIVEVAALAGFADGPHFTRAYKARFGQPPAEGRLPPAAPRSDVPDGRRLFPAASMAG